MTFAPASTACLMVGIVRTMRSSSVILPSSSGTLKSTRMKTRFPSSGSSEIRRMPSSDTMSASALLRHEEGEIDHAIRESPLVVVPGEDLGKVVAEDLRLRGVEDAGVRVA